MPTRIDDVKVKSPLPPKSGGPLGIHAVSVANNKIQQKPRATGTVLDAGARRRDRLHRAAARLFADKASKVAPDGSVVPHFLYRQAMCMRGTDGGPVGIYRNKVGTKAEFSGLQTCGSPWTCPHCAPRIAGRRVKEVNSAIAAWVQEGQMVYFVTNTNQHNATTAGQGECKARMAAFAESLKKFKATRLYKKFREQYTVKGEIRGLETSYGEMNGWHHHTHSILFAQRGLLVENEKGRLIRHRSPLWKLARPWVRQLIKDGLAGLLPGDTGLEKRAKLKNLMLRAFDAKPGAYAAEYLAKYGKEPERERGRWGLGSEVTKSHMKVARGPENHLPRRCSHASPFELLNDYLDGDERSGELFREFGDAMKGRARLFWSRGLKRAFNIEELQDSDAAVVTDETCNQFVCEIAPADWRVVLSHDARFEVRRIAALAGAEGVRMLIEKLARDPPTHFGGFTESGEIASRLRKSSRELLDEFQGKIYHARAAQ